MSTNFETKIKRLKEKLELEPKHVIKQTQTSEFAIYTFDLTSYVDPDQIINACKTYNKEQVSRLKYVNALSSDFLVSGDTIIIEFEQLFNIVTDKVKPIWNLPYTFLISEYWFSIYSNGDRANTHNHGSADLACVYYASVPEGSAPLVIPTVGGEISVIPKQGMLVVMPGNCLHLVPKSEHDGERIIVAMNIIKDKFLGLNDTTVSSV